MKFPTNQNSERKEEKPFQICQKMIEELKNSDLAFFKRISHH